MTVVYEFRCDSCGTRRSGVAGDYLYQDPPQGWVWRFGSSLEGPHACSRTCWDKVKWTDDGKIILHMDHEKMEMRRLPEPPPLPEIPPLPPLRPKEVHSWVYFAQRGDDGPIKIGTSKHPVSRVKDLSSASAEGLMLLGVIPGSRKEEQQLHLRFTSCRLNGEWFRPDAALCAYIAEHARPP